MLESLSWSNLVVSRLCLDDNLENGNADQMAAAEDDLQVRFIHFFGFFRPFFSVQISNFGHKVTLN